MNACRRCRAEVDPAHRYCGRCGTDLRAEAAGGTPEPVRDPMVGRIIGERYRILQLLGTGGMGVVYKVEHVAMGKVAALKMLHPNLSADREVARRFRSEAQAVARLEHPNTVQVFDFGISEGTLYMVMEFVRGQDLGAILRRDGRLPWTRAAPLLLQVCDALSEAHDAGIVHRDLKPENVMVARNRVGDEVAKVLDFGLAKLRRKDDLSVTARGSLVGTPFYMSPEQIRAEELDARSDIYSLGAMLYRMLVGAPPFSGPTPLAVVSAHLTEKLVPPSQRAPDVAWDARVEALILRAMARSAGDRFPRVEALREAIAEARGPDASPVPRAPLSTGDRREASVAGAPLQPVRLRREDFDRFESALRVRRWAGILTLPVLLAAGGVAGWVWLRHDRPRPVEVEVEPNDTPQTANPIAPGSTVRGTIGRRLKVDESDRDLFHFTAPPGRSLLRVELGPIPKMDVVLELFDGRGARVATADNAGPGEGEVLPNQRLEGGDFYLEVREQWIPGRQATEDVTDQYALHTTLRPLAPDEESEPDNAPEEAIAVTLERPVRGYLARPNDLDWFYPEGGGGGALSGQVSGIDDVDVRLIVLPPGAATAGDPAHAPGARVFDAGGPGHGERFADVPWPSGGAAPLVVVERKDRKPTEGRGPSLPGIDTAYALTLERVPGAARPGQR